MDSRKRNRPGYQEGPFKRRVDCHQAISKSNSSRAKFHVDFVNYKNFEVILSFWDVDGEFVLSCTFYAHYFCFVCCLCTFLAYFSTFLNDFEAKSKNNFLGTSMMLPYFTMRKCKRMFVGIIVSWPSSSTLTMRQLGLSAPLLNKWSRWISLA